MDLHEIENKKITAFNDCLASHMKVLRRKQQCTQMNRPATSGEGALPRRVPVTKLSTQFNRRASVKYNLTPEELAQVAGENRGVVEESRPKTKSRRRKSKSKVKVQQQSARQTAEAARQAAPPPKSAPTSNRDMTKSDPPRLVIAAEQHHGGDGIYPSPPDMPKSPALALRLLAKLNSEAAVKTGGPGAVGGKPMAKKERRRDRAAMNELVQDYKDRQGAGVVAYTSPQAVDSSVGLASDSEDEYGRRKNSTRSPASESEHTQYQSASGRPKSGRGRPAPALAPSQLQAPAATEIQQEVEIGPETTMERPQTGRGRGGRTYTVAATDGQQALPAESPGLTAVPVSMPPRDRSPTRSPVRVRTSNAGGSGIGSPSTPTGTPRAHDRRPSSTPGSGRKQSAAGGGVPGSASRATRSTIVMAREMGTDAKTLSFVKEFMRGFDKTQHAGFVDQHPDAAPSAMEFEHEFKSRFSEKAPSASAAAEAAAKASAKAALASESQRRGSMAGQVKVRPDIADPKPRHNIHNRPPQTISEKLKIGSNIYSSQGTDSCGNVILNANVNKFHFFENDMVNNAAMVKERGKSITQGYRKGVGRKREKLARENYLRMMAEADDLLNNYYMELNQPMQTEPTAASGAASGAVLGRTSPDTSPRKRPASAPMHRRKPGDQKVKVVPVAAPIEATAPAASDDEVSEDEEGEENYEEEFEEEVLDPNYKPFGPVTYEMKMENLMKEVLQTDFYDISHSLEAEVQEIHTGFQRLDKDKDGFLTYNDLYNYCKEHYDLEFEQQLHHAIAFKQSTFDQPDSHSKDGALLPSKEALKELEEPLRELVWQLDDSRRNSLTFEDVRKYYIRYFNEKNEAEAMVIRNEVEVPHSRYGTVIEKRVADKYADAYRNRHIAENPLLYHLLLFAYLEGGDAFKYYQGPKSPGMGYGDEHINSETTQAELLLLPALHKLITLYGHERADQLFLHLFGRSAGSLSDTDFIYFSAYINRIVGARREKLANYRDNIVSLSAQDRVHLFEELQIKPRLERMRAAAAKRPITAAPSRKRPSFK